MYSEFSMLSIGQLTGKHFKCLLLDQCPDESQFN